MNCAWKELLSVLPQWLRGQLCPYENTLLELRLRLGSAPELKLTTGSRWLEREVSQEDLHFCLNAASRYSPWAAATVSQGFVTAPGGHRMGLCGEAVMKDGAFSGIRTLHSLCIRVARDFPGIAKDVDLRGRGLLILGAPGWGKTTLLRDLCRKVSQSSTLVVVDERQELFPPGLAGGCPFDILYGCPKERGTQMVLRTMGPECIAVDEITDAQDCQAIIQAANCGVRLLATAHGVGMEDFRRRRVYAPLREAGIFDSFLVLHRDRTFHREEWKE